MAGVGRSLLVWLVLLAAARACDERHRPTIAAATTTTSSVTRYKSQVHMESQYGERVRILCSADNITGLGIHEAGRRLPTEQHNATAVQLLVQRNVGLYKYTCTDNTGCESALSLLVQPAMSVASPSVYNEMDTYFVPIGETYDVLCSGDQKVELHFKTSLAVEDIEYVNATSVKHTTQADRREQKTYWCLDQKGVGREIKVVTDYKPEADNFWCTLYYWQKLECSWQSSSDKNTFQLFYTDPYNEDTSLLYADSSGQRAVTCNFSNRFRGRQLIYVDQTFTLLLRICNVFCRDQTYTINANSITKLKPVSQFVIFSSHTTPYSAFLAWSRSFTIYLHPVCTSCEYKLEYRLKMFGEKWRQVDLSSMLHDKYTCKLQLSLPYPDTEYEARIYVRLEEAVEDKLWSEPTSIPSIVTQPTSSQCSCNATQPTTPSRALCEVCELKEHAIKQNLALRKLNSNLKKKRDELLKKIQIIDKMRNLSSQLSST